MNNASQPLVTVHKRVDHAPVPRKSRDYRRRIAQSYFITRAESPVAAPEPPPTPVDPIGLEALQIELKAATAASQEAREGLAAANARLGAMEDIISNLKADRDAWRAQAEVLASRLRGVLAKIFGR